jgi:hypothetical protein
VFIIKLTATVMLIQPRIKVAKRIDLGVTFVKTSSIFVFHSHTVHSVRKTGEIDVCSSRVTHLSDTQCTAVI